MAMVQARGVFSFDPIKFKFERLNPADGFQRIFSTRQLIELLKMILKVMVLVGVLIWVVKTGVSPLVASMYAPADETSSPTVKLLQILFWCVAVLLLVFGMIDFGHQYFEFIKQNRMDDLERKREYRELEGDPHVKAELKAQRRALQQSPITPGNGIEGASVLLTNPTHYSVALFYEAGVVELPVLVAKGEDSEAFQLRRDAQRLSIPIMENPPLCRALFREVGLRQYIGEDHIEQVAEVFRWLQSLKQATGH
jgi:type III secretion protein U